MNDVQPEIAFKHRPDTVETYTGTPESAYLATAIYDRAQWDISVVECRGEVLHVAMRLHDGRYLDISGIWTAKDMLARWTTDEHDDVRLRQVQIHEMRKLVTGSLYSWSFWQHVSKAGPFARRIIANTDKQLGLVAA